jgi:hypothetical protein
MALVSPGTEKALRAALSPFEFELVLLHKDSELLDYLAESDIVMMDSTVKRLDLLCHAISRLVPVVLIVNDMHANWNELKSLEVHGFVHNEASGAEMAARLLAISRRHTGTRAGKMGGKTRKARSTPVKRKIEALQIQL